MLEKMRVEIESLGHSVQWAVINKIDAESTQQELIDKCSMPIFQDTAAVDAWSLHKGNKDDFFIYDKVGKLAKFLPVSGEISVVLSEDEGYNNLKNAIFEVLGVPIPPPESE
jgi:hypothetical protein